MVDGASPVVRFEQIDAIYSDLSIVHASRRTLVISGTSELKYIPDPSGPVGDVFINDNSAMSITMGESCFNGKPFTKLVEECRDGQVRILERGQVPGRTNGSLIVLYAGGR